MFSKAFVEALLEDFRQWGPQAIARVRTETPAAYLRVCAMLGLLAHRSPDRRVPIVGAPTHQLFSSRWSSLKKRQSVPCVMILVGVDLIMPASCNRRE